MSQGEVARRGHRLPEGYALLSVAPVQVALLVRQTVQIIRLDSVTHVVILCYAIDVPYFTAVQY